MTKDQRDLNSVPMEQFPPPSLQQNNPELLLWSLYVVGGSERFVDVEEIYLKTFEIAPARLSWRTRRDIPDYKKCAKALQEVEDPKRSSFVGAMDKKGSYQRRLTNVAVKWIQTHEAHFTELYRAGTVRSATNQDDHKLMRALDRSEALAAFRLDPNVKLSEFLVADALGCLPGSSDATYAQRFDRLLGAASRNDRPELEAFIAHCREQVKGLRK